MPPVQCMFPPSRPNSCVGSTTCGSGQLLNCILSKTHPPPAPGRTIDTPTAVPPSAQAINTYWHRRQLPVPSTGLWQEHAAMSNTAKASMDGVHGWGAWMGRGAGGAPLCRV